MVRGDPRPEVFWLRDLLPINVAADSRYTMATLGNPGERLVLRNWLPI